MNSKVISRLANIDARATSKFSEKSRIYPLILVNHKMQNLPLSTSGVESIKHR